MKDTIRILGLSAALSCGTAWAQQAPPADAPAIRPDVPAAGDTAKASAKRSQATAQAEAGEPRANTSDPPAEAARAPSTDRPARASTASAAAQKSGSPKSANAVDKLQLGTATVTGDREQPKVMYVVPWKKPDIGDAQGKPMNSLVDEILSPVDRDVFKREVGYYQTVKAQAGQNGAPAAAEQVEK